MTQSAGTVEVWCYWRHLVGEYPTYRVAKAALAHHIWTCPQGAMPWARPIRWHRVAYPGRVVTATAAHGEWLDHFVEQRPGGAAGPAAGV